MTDTAVPYSGYGQHWESVLQVGERYGSHILRKGGTMWRRHMDWPGAVLHMEDSEVDSASLG